ncbi:MAG: ABC transporter ATP-binding protein [Lachnospiraceae bacterium]|nr:ABC transporter ATP-binding protein [Lachnospiraceae bacterium]
MRIEGKNLKKSFTRLVKDETLKKRERKESFFAVNDITVSASEGEILGILGPNGAGKTTLLRMLSGIMKPDFGEVCIADGDGTVLNDEKSIKRNIGYISGNTKLYGRFSPRELLYMFGEIYGMEEAAIKERSEEIIKLLDMESFADSRVSALSTGQTQRAGISRCLIHSPEIYIFDEPTLGLDILSSRTILDFMKNERDRGATVLYSTHYMEEAEFLCDRIVMIYKGMIIAQGTPASLKEDTGASNLREVFLKLINDREDKSDE